MIPSVNNNKLLLSPVFISKMGSIFGHIDSEKNSKK